MKKPAPARGGSGLGRRPPLKEAVDYLLFVAKTTCQRSSFLIW